MSARNPASLSLTSLSLSLVLQTTIHSLRKRWTHSFGRVIVRDRPRLDLSAAKELYPPDRAKDGDSRYARRTRAAGLRTRHAAGPATASSSSASRTRFSIPAFQPFELDVCTAHCSPVRTLKTHKIR
ncbi:hypothetical protein EDC01DRAFT_465200 [Geopyxis carbonaria]|nr:hypothetical protein EDC01DRAFT_465200 [Geopyxis carbonaria]